MIWTFRDVLVDILDASKEVCTELNIDMASKEHGEMWVIGNNMLIGEGDVGLLTLGNMSLHCAGEAILWSSMEG